MVVIRVLRVRSVKIVNAGRRRRVLLSASGRNGPLQGLLEFRFENGTVDTYHSIIIIVIHDGWYWIIIDILR